MKKHIYLVSYQYKSGCGDIEITASKKIKPIDIKDIRETIKRAIHIDIGILIDKVVISNIHYFGKKKVGN